MMQSLSPMCAIIFIISQLLAIGFVTGSEQAHAFIEDLLTGYNRKVRPLADEDARLNIEYKIHINAFGSIDAIHSEFTMDFILQQSWNDPRLAYKNSSKPNKPNHDLEFGYERVGDIWIPDTYIKNVKKAIRQSITVPNIRITIQPDGMVHYSQRLTTILSCEMDLHFYPVDSQTCGLQLQPFGHTSNHISVNWASEDAVEFEDHLSMAEFKYPTLKTTYYNCSRSYPFSGGHFSCVAVSFTMDREISYYILGTFVPTALIVLAAWSSFWVDATAVPARTAIALLCMMTLSTKSSGLMQHLPKVAYVKVIDVWMVGCLIFVILSFIEFVAVNALNRKERKLKASNAEIAIDLKDGGAYAVVPEKKQKEMCLTGTKFEQCFRVGYPAAFIIFNIFFWMYALGYLSSEVEVASE